MEDSYWSSIRKLGEQGLASGLISPEEAQMHLQALQTGEPDLSGGEVADMNPPTAADTPIDRSPAGAPPYNGPWKPGYTPPAVPKPPAKKQIVHPNPRPVSPVSMAPQAPIDPARTPYAMGSGLSAEEQKKLEEQNQSKKMSQQFLFRDPRELAADMKILSESEPYRSEQQGIEDNMQLLRNQANAIRPGLDLTPLMQLSDAWSGSHFTQGYKAPNSDQQLKDILAQAEKIQGERKDYSRNLSSEAKGLKAGSTTDMMSQILATKTLQDFLSKAPPIPRPAGGPNADTNAYSKWISDQVKPLFTNPANGLDKKDRELAELFTTVKSANATTDPRIPILLASIDAHGRPNMAEVNMESGARDVVSRAQQSWDWLKEGKISDKNRADILSHLQDIARYHDAIREAQAHIAANVGKRKYRVSGDDFNAQFPETYIHTNKWMYSGDNEKAGPPPDADLSKMNREQLKEYLKTHGGS